MPNRRPVVVHTVNRARWRSWPAIGAIIAGSFAPLYVLALVEWFA